MDFQIKYGREASIRKLSIMTRTIQTSQQKSSKISVCFAEFKSDNNIWIRKAHNEKKIFSSKAKITSSQNLFLNFWISSRKSVCMYPNNLREQQQTALWNQLHIRGNVIACISIGVLCFPARRRSFQSRHRWSVFAPVFIKQYVGAGLMFASARCSRSLSGTALVTKNSLSKFSENRDPPSMSCVRMGN